MGTAPAIGDRMVTIGQALARARKTLEATSPTARLDAEVLLGRTLDCSRARLLAHPGASIDPGSAQRFEMLVERRRDGEPIAYLTGHREFWSLDLVVTPDTLIPRPETEHLVEAVLGVVSADDATTIADIGTGAGAVALALAHECPRAFVLGSDRSRAAVDVARANALRLGAGNVSFIVADACAALAPKRWSVIVSNPPYVAEHDPHLATGDVRFEPREALVAGPLGLDRLETLARQAPARLVRGGWLVLEHGRVQGPAVRALLSRAGLEVVETLRDLAENERVTLGRRAATDDTTGDPARSPAPLIPGTGFDMAGPCGVGDGLGRAGTRPGSTGTERAVDTGRRVPVQRRSPSNPGEVRPCRHPAQTRLLDGAS